MVWIGAFLFLGVCQANPCDILKLVSEHEVHFQPGLLSVQLNADGDLVLVQGHEFMQSWKVREKVDGTVVLPAPFQSPFPGSAVLSLDGKKVLIVEEIDGLWWLHDIAMHSGSTTNRDSWLPSNGIPHLVTDRLAVVQVPPGEGQDPRRRHLDVWDPTSQDYRFPLQHIAPGPIRDITLSPGGHFLGLRFKSGEIAGRIASANSGTTLFDVKEGWESIAFSPDFGTVAYAGQDGVIHWRKALDGIPLRTAFDQPESYAVKDLIFVDDNRLLSNHGKFIRDWEMEERYESDKDVRIEMVGDVVGRMVASPNRKWLVTSHQKGEVLIWDFATYQPVAQLIGHTHPVESIQFSNDNSTILTVDKENHLRVWDLDPRMRAKEGSVWRTDGGVFTVTRSQTGNNVQIRLERNLWL